MSHVRFCSMEVACKWIIWWVSWSDLIWHQESFVNNAKSVIVSYCRHQSLFCEGECTVHCTNFSFFDRLFWIPNLDTLQCFLWAGTTDLDFTGDSWRWSGSQSAQLPWSHSLCAGLSQWFFSYGSDTGRCCSKFNSLPKFQEKKYIYIFFHSVSKSTIFML